MNVRRFRAPQLNYFLDSLGTQGGAVLLEKIINQLTRGESLLTG